MDMEKVNSMDFGEFVDVFGNVIERCPLIAAAVWSQRPFSDLEDLEKHFSAFIDALPQSERASLDWIAEESKLIQISFSRREVKEERQKSE
ncbi:2-oxo-4-hydroxy-4-carboxy-5-ureidoimidazoline decarboxylase [Myotis brandtii]|uniref:2-oxo-4-hydroxy-4-carboxy-5-ureidoimidazoline decarboxylase n=1 Tax=Myotis brandtii TaxID=109478 RepID=S7NDM7_MYOBR|nr:2-oxo-4-hydroxy-4-carboxy-5-ureidoimidazoline decarboxylase [Myotis brandtii]